MKGKGRKGKKRTKRGRKKDSSKKQTNNQRIEFLGISYIFFFSFFPRVWLPKKRGVQKGPPNSVQNRNIHLSVAEKKKRKKKWISPVVIHQEVPAFQVSLTRGAG